MGFYPTFEGANRIIFIVKTADETRDTIVNLVNAQGFNQVQSCIFLVGCFVPECCIKEVKYIPLSIFVALDIISKLR
jgi:hypothetical protein